MSNDMVRLLIGGDIVPTRSNINVFETPESGKLVDSDLKELLTDADYRIFNLEAPFTDRTGTQAGQGISKVGPTLSAPKKCVNGLKVLGADFVSLANNHILDYGSAGLQDTTETLKQAGISYGGAGADKVLAATPFYAEVKGVRIGIYCCAEHEFSIVTDTNAGANPFDPMESPAHIAEMRSNCDYLIVLYHGGVELYRYPSPQLRRVCRKCVESGADLVLCQHSHCVGAKEQYTAEGREGTILYGQGNFLFDRKSDTYWDSGLLVEVCFNTAGQTKVICHPIVKNGGCVELAQGTTGQEILDGLERRSEEIKDVRNVEKFYAEFAEKKADAYLQAFLGKGSKTIFFKLKKRIFGKSKVIGNCFLQEDLLKIQNIMECEAHRELLLQYLKHRR